MVSRLIPLQISQFQEYLNALFSDSDRTEDRGARSRVFDVLEHDQDEVLVDVVKSASFVFLGHLDFPNDLEPAAGVEPVSQGSSWSSLVNRTGVRSTRLGSPL